MNLTFSLAFSYQALYRRCPGLGRYQRGYPCLLQEWDTVRGLSRWLKAWMLQQRQEIV